MRSTNKTDAPSYTVQVPTQSIPYPLTVIEGEGNPPFTPTLQGVDACTVNAPYTVTMKSVDPDNDGLRYAIDWNNDGSVDQFVPSTGYVPSGLPQSASRTFTTPGGKTVKVMAIDEKGNHSGWATVQFSCAGESAQSGTFSGLGTGGGFTPAGGGGDSGVTPTATVRAVPLLVRSGERTRIFWDATSVSSCTLTGSNGDRFPGDPSATLPLSGDAFTSPIVSATTYTLICRTLGNHTLSASAIINIVPSWGEI